MFEKILKFWENCYFIFNFNHILKFKNFRVWQHTSSTPSCAPTPTSRCAGRQASGRRTPAHGRLCCRAEDKLRCNLGCRSSLRCTRQGRIGWTSHGRRRRTETQSIYLVLTVMSHSLLFLPFGYVSGKYNLSLPKIIKSFLHYYSIIGNGLVCPPICNCNLDIYIFYQYGEKTS